MATFQVADTAAGYAAPRFTGTLTADGSTAIVGKGTDFVEALEGKTFRFVGEDTDYTIASVTDATPLVTTPAVPVHADAVAILSSEDNAKLDANWHRLGTAAAADTEDFQAANADTTILGNTTTGTGAIVLATSPALTTPNVGVASGNALTLSGSIATRNFYVEELSTTSTYAPEGTLGHDCAGIYVHNTFSGASNTSGAVNVNGIYTAPTWSGAIAAGTVGRLYGMYLAGIYTGAGTLQALVECQLGSTINNADAVVTSRYGLHIGNPTIVAGSIGINYGIYIANQTAGTTDYAIYSAGGKSYHAGNFGIGTTSPAVALDIHSTTGVQNYRYASGTAGGYILCGHSKSDTVGTITYLTLNDEVGKILCQSPNADSWYTSGGVFWHADQTHSSGKIGTRMEFKVTPNDSTTYATALVATNAGDVGIGTGSTASARLHVIKTTEQLRLGYDTTYYTSFTVSNAGVLTIAPQGSAVVVSGTITATQLKLSALNTAPANAGDTGTAGEIRIDADYIYVCVAANTWKRAAIATWS